MKKSRKLAWVVLGAVVVGVVAVIVQLSSLYSPWQPFLGSRIISMSGPQRQPQWLVLRSQRFPWLPGADLEYREVSEDEYFELSLGMFRPVPVSTR